MGYTNKVLCALAEQSGMERNRAEWNGTERKGTEMERNRAERNGTERKGTQPCGNDKEPRRAYAVSRTRTKQIEVLNRAEGNAM